MNRHLNSLAAANWLLCVCFVCVCACVCVCASVCACLCVCVCDACGGFSFDVAAAAMDEQVDRPVWGEWYLDLEVGPVQLPAQWWRRHRWEVRRAALLLLEALVREHWEFFFGDESI